MTNFKEKITIFVLIFIMSALVILMVAGMISVVVNCGGNSSQYKYIVIGDKQYVIEELSDLWERRDFIEFTTKDGNRIHATTYELRK